MSNKFLVYYYDTKRNKSEFVSFPTKKDAQAYIKQCKKFKDRQHVELWSVEDEV